MNDEFSTPAPTRRLVRIAIAAGLYGVTVKTVRNRIDDGTLTGYRFGSRTILIDLDEMDAMLSLIPPRQAGRIAG